MIDEWPGERNVDSVSTSHFGSSSQGKWPAPGATASSARGIRPAYSAARSGGSPTSYSPVTSSTGASRVASAARTRSGSNAPSA